MDEVRTVVGTTNGPLRRARIGKSFWRIWYRVAITSGMLLLVTNSTWASDDATKAAVLLHYNSARAALELKQYTEAAKEFQLAYEQLPLPVTGLWAGRCYSLSGDLATAKTIYLEVMHLTPNEMWHGDKQQQAQMAASREIERMSLPIVTSAPVHLARKIERPSKAPLRQPVEQVSNPWRTAGWVSLSLGASALTLGAVSGLLLVQHRSEMRLNCPNGICDPDAVSQGEVDRHNDLRVASSIGFVAGSVFGALGVALVLGTSAKATKNELAVRLAPTGALLHGAF
jgi:hypothetical protein